MNFAVIDDSESILFLLENILLTFYKGSKVSKFFSSEEFFQSSEPASFDLIITDLSLPGISGKELAKMIKLKYKNMPILLVTANGSSELVRELFVNNIIEDYVDKPIKPEIIIERINRILENNASAKENYFWIRDIATGNRFKIEVDTVNFMRTSGENKTIDICTNENIYSARGTLAEMAEKLGANFIKLSRFLIINQNKIKQLNSSNYKVEFNSGHSLELSRLKYLELEKHIF